MSVPEGTVVTHAQVHVPRMATRSTRVPVEDLIEPCPIVQGGEQGGETSETIHSQQQVVLPNVIGVQNKKKPPPKSKKPTVLELSKTVNTITRSLGQVSNSVSILQQNASTSDNRVQRVEAKMDGLESKMDFLISMATKEKEAAPPPVVPSRPRQPATCSNDNSYMFSRPEGDCVVVQDDTRDRLPPPSVLRREENQAGAIDAMLEREEYHPPQGHGKLQAMLSDN